jgi:hypothetical protein
VNLPLLPADTANDATLKSSTSPLLALVSDAFPRLPVAVERIPPPHPPHERLLFVVSPHLLGEHLAPREGVERYPPALIVRLRVVEHLWRQIQTQHCHVGTVDV